MQGLVIIVPGRFLVSARVPVLVLNGPNLNTLGARQPSVYGRMTLSDIEAMCHRYAHSLDFDLSFRQSNDEGKLVTWVQESQLSYQGLIVNMAAYSHTSIALMDALLSTQAPTIEVHLSNIHKRESFRHRSYVSRAVHATISGMGGYGYVLALQALHHLLADHTVKDQNHEQDTYR